jgi:hypothetical protein
VYERLGYADQSLASLLADAEFLNHSLITLDIELFEIVQQATTPANHHQKTAARSVILLVRLEMVRQLIDALTQDRDLDLRTAGVARVCLVRLDDVGFLLSG